MDDLTRRTYTVEEAASILGIRRSLAYDLAREGKLPALRLGRRVLIPRAAIDEILRAASMLPQANQARP